jgi:hypothetical protein
MRGWVERRLAVRFALSFYDEKPTALRPVG